MPFKTQQSTIDKILKIVKEHGVISKTELIEKSKVHSYSIDKILNILIKEGEIIVAKYQSFIGDKVVTQSFDIKYIGEKK